VSHGLSEVISKDLTSIHLGNSFLANIARRSTSVLVPAPKPASEFDRFVIYEHGKDETLALEHPLLWWKVSDFSHHCTLCYLLFLLKAHQHEFPVIARMARDFLAIPGAMVSVERLFSKSRHLCADQCSSLKAATLTQAMCTKEWLQEGLMKWN
jgi:hypothetical protein